MREHAQASPSSGFHDPTAEAFPATAEGRLLFWIAVAFSLFQIATAAHWLDLPSQVVRACHVGFLLLLTYPLVAMGKGPVWKAVAWLLALAAVGVAVYQWWEYKDLLLRAGDASQLDVVVGVVAMGTIFVATWVLMGPALPVICGFFLAYCLFGQYLPDPLNHRGYDFAQVVEHMAYGTEGIYGVPTYVSSSYIFLFILFGSFLEKAGMIKLFTDVALGLVGHAQGGAAKVAVVSSALMGTISGSGVANVVTTGQFTIPLMKRFGYRAAFAGGVEATASMGGQLMPPVMGAVAFIMAETLGVEYAEIVQAAIIPAILYYFGAFWMVHLEAGKHGLVGLKKSELPSAWLAIKTQWFLIIPLAALVWLLVGGYTPLFAGTVGLAFTVVLILGASIAIGLPSLAIRVLFWIGLGVVCAAFLKFGTGIVAAAIAILIGINAFSQGGRETVLACRDSLAEGAKSALPVGVACAIVGVIIGTVTLTGAANTFGQYVVSVGQNSLILSLVLTMVTCIILGMGIPTIPNYIITSSIAGPALEQLGVPLIISHMFVFYFGILADLTPPVALACFAAAPIAKERGLNISIEAVKIAAAGFVIPYMAVYDPALMLQVKGDWHQYLPGVAYMVFKSVLAIALWGVSVIGYLGVRLPVWMRLLSTAAAFLLIAAVPATDEIGFVLSAVFAVLVWRMHKATLESTARSA
ncbi:TRAP transporter permease [Limnobacter humi]|uniref:TRAP transporter permease n=1 Tax=Limnobacter humi TaxID=1778671 RepID=A0ABT1WHY2_9BURK|nr:TRAP transporter permease [Limnobacter humi]MCQ8896646.1 TRAP transporter permease [Limnobacter humi]